MFDAGGHQTPGVDHDDDTLIAFDLVLPGDQPPAPRRGRPRNVPHLVAADVIAHAFEFAALPANARLSRPEEHLAIAPRRQLVPPRFIDVRVDFDSLSRLDPILFDDQPPRAAAAYDEVAEPVIAARSRVEFVSDRRLAVGSPATDGRGDEQPLATQLQARGIFVFDRQRELAPKPVADHDPDFVLFADHETARDVAGYFDLRDVFHATVVDVSEEQQDQVVGDEAPFDARRAPGEDQWQNAQREKNEEATSKDHMDELNSRRATEPQRKRGKEIAGKASFLFLLCVSESLWLTDFINAALRPRPRSHPAPNRE